MRRSVTNSPTRHRRNDDAPSLDGLGPLDAAMVRGVESGHWIIERLMEAVEREMERVEAAPHDEAARGRVALLMSALDECMRMADSMFGTLRRRAAEHERLRACHAAPTEIARHARAEARAWAQIAPVRADLADALRAGIDLRAALALTIPRVDRIARRRLLESRHRIERTIRHATLRAPRARARARTSRRRRCAASRARPSSSSDGEPPRPLARARGPPPTRRVAAPKRQAFRSSRSGCLGWARPTCRSSRTWPRPVRRLISSRERR